MMRDPSNQPSLFGADPGLPEGLRYLPDIVDADGEAKLVARIAELDLKPFEFQGFLGKRRVTSFGWRYVFDGTGLIRAEDMPRFLLPLRERAARFAGLEPDSLRQVLLTEYADGAGIGWHRDRPVFDEVVGISLVSPAVLRFRRQLGSKWERASLAAAPRSAYLLTGEARSQWEHSIAPLDALRYSITFRSFRPEVEAQL